MGQIDPKTGAAGVKAVFHRGGARVRSSRGVPRRFASETGSMKKGGARPRERDGNILMARWNCPVPRIYLVRERNERGGRLLI